MAATVTLPAAELAKFSAAMRSIVAATGASAEDVTRGFAGRVLKKWAGKTKVVTEQNILRRARARTAKGLSLSRAGDNSAGITINNGARGGYTGEVWRRTSSNPRKFQQAGLIIGNSTFGFVPSWKHWKTSVWSDISHTALTYAHKLSERYRAGLQSIHLSRQSVIQIADALGIDLLKVPGQGIGAQGIAKARAALASSGKHYINGTGRSVASARGFMVELVNNYPKGTATGMDYVLAGVIGAEIKYYERNLANGIFLSHERVARAYPFLKVAAA